jgi:hypothetical protein
LNLLLLLLLLLVLLLLLLLLCLCMQGIPELSQLVAYTAADVADWCLER